MKENLLGNSGEDYITQLCSNDNLVCNNSSSNDKKGWDLLIEFHDDSKNKDIPLDRRSDNIECRIQVKSTERTDRTDFSISLKNMYNLINYKYPVFFCQCYFIKQNNYRVIDKVAIKHLDEELINKSLKRIRILEEAATLDLLNKRKISFKHSEYDYIDLSKGTSLREKILSVIKNNIDDYCLWKDKIRIGQNKQVMNFSFSPEIQQEDIRDNFLGQKEKLKIEKVKFFDERYGIKLPINEFDHALLDFRSKPKNVNVYVSLGKYSKDRLHLLCDFRNTKNAGALLKKEFHTFLFIYKAVTIKLNILDSNINIDLSRECFYTIDELTKVIDFILMVKESYQKKKNLYFEVHLDNIISFGFRNNNFNPENINDLQEKCYAFNRILNILGNKFVNTKFTITDIDRIAPEVESMDLLLSMVDSEENLLIQITLNEVIDEEINNDTLSFIPFLRKIIIGDVTHYILLGYIGIMQLLDKQTIKSEIIFRQGKLEIIDILSVNIVSDIEDEIINRFYKYQNEYPIELYNCWPEKWFQKFKKLNEKNEN